MAEPPAVFFVSKPRSARRRPASYFHPLLENRRFGVERGRKTKAKLKVGICGEHGGDPASVAFCHEIALDYVSCSPFRVPIARLAAAQAALGKGAAGEA